MTEREKQLEALLKEFYFLTGDESGVWVEWGKSGTKALQKTRLKVKKLIEIED